jgi:glycosyltransferase involved in cell wall biosynthesis
VHELAGEDPRIAFHGPFPPDQRAAIYAEMDVLVIPSAAQETFSFVAREALLAGVPVIAARAGALTEILFEGVNGFLYPPEDESALSAIIARIARQPQLLGELRLPGPVEILDTSAHILRLEQVYQAAAARKAVQ